MKLIENLNYITKVMRGGKKKSLNMYIQLQNLLLKQRRWKLFRQYACESEEKEAWNIKNIEIKQCPQLHSIFQRLRVPSDHIQDYRLKVIFMKPRLRCVLNLSSHCRVSSFNKQLSIM